MAGTSGQNPWKRVPDTSMMMPIMMMMSLTTMMMMMLMMVTMMVVMMLNDYDELSTHSNMCVCACARSVMKYPSWQAK
jgi:hypothetical protein